MAGVPEKSLERYDLLERIAVGGMAEVFRAKAYGAHGFEKTLAIKRILPELARDQEFEERFIAEAKVAVELSHTNVVQVFDFGRFDGTLFIAMEFVDGLDLAALLRRHRERGTQVPVAAAFHIAIEIARGLDFAHQRGVVHRDVSPSNVLLSRAGEVKIADFGIAVPASGVGSAGGSGRRRRIMGKWRYMSPEQARGETLTTRSDLFSAAVVIYELFTGEKLFPGEEAEQIIDNIHAMAIPRPSVVRAGLPPRLDEILGRTLARAPVERPVRAAEILRALTELSYESSIVCTSLDVAEAVGWALTPQPGPNSRGAAGASDGVVVAPSLSGKSDKMAAAGERRGIDDLIRAHLLGGAAAEPDRETSATGVRRTAISDGDRRTPRGDDTHTATIVKAGVDGDGLTLWTVEEDVDDDEGADDDEDELTIGAVPSAIKGRRGGAAEEGAAAAGEPDEARAGSADEERPRQAGAGSGLAGGVEPTTGTGRGRRRAADSGVEPTTGTGRGRRRAADSGVGSAGPGSGTDLDAAAARATSALAARAAESAQAASATVTPVAPASATRSRVPLLFGMLAAGALVAVAAGVLATRDRGERPPAATSATSDTPASSGEPDKEAAGASVPDADAVLRIDTEPAGATVRVDGTESLRLTPVDVPVAAGAHRVEIFLDGYELHVDESVLAAAGETVRVRAILEPALARLVVRTEPSGVAVSAAGRELGTTPLDVSDLSPQVDSITLAKPGFQTISVAVDLRAGDTATVERTLRAVERHGTIDLSIEDGWAEVYLKNRKIGRAPARGLRLPVGKHRLRLVNPVSGRRVDLDVEVVDGQVKFYRTRLGS